MQHSIKISEIKVQVAQQNKKKLVDSFINFYNLDNALYVVLNCLSLVFFLINHILYMTNYL